MILQAEIIVQIAGYCIGGYIANLGVHIGQYCDSTNSTNKSNACTSTKVLTCCRVYLSSANTESVFTASHNGDRFWDKNSDGMATVGAEYKATLIPLVHLDEIRDEKDQLNIEMVK